MNRYSCEQGHSFSISHKEKFPILWLRHIDGAPIRKLAVEVELSIAQTYEHVLRELKQLPNSNKLTREYCSRFCGILIVDAKYIKVRGYPKKIPFIFGIDYLTHDIICCLLAPSENQLAYEKFFGMLRRMQYPMRVVCADDNGAVKPALNRVFPRAGLQTCQNHYLENIRRALCVRTDETHREFFFSLKKLVFDQHEHFARLRGVLRHLLIRYALRSPARQEILLDIERRKFELFAYTKIPRCPKNTNLIELYNSHLNGRLKTIKGFKSFASAARWLNAYVIWRRTKTLTDCGPTFKHLNGHCSFELTIKKQAEWPAILGLKH